MFRAGRSKIAKKLAEEAIEVVIDAMNGDRNAVVRESADLLYNLVVVWAASGVRPSEVWKEMDRRERLFGIAEKLLKRNMLAKGRTKVASSVGAAGAPPAMIPGACRLGSHRAALPRNSHRWTMTGMAYMQARHAEKRI